MKFTDYPSATSLSDSDLLLVSTSDGVKKVTNKVVKSGTINVYTLGVNLTEAGWYRIAEWTDTSSTTATIYLRRSYHNIPSEAYIIDFCTIYKSSGASNKKSYFRSSFGACGSTNNHLISKIRHVQHNSKQYLEIYFDPKSSEYEYVLFNILGVSITDFKNVLFEKETVSDLDLVIFETYDIPVTPQPFVSKDFEYYEQVENFNGDKEIILTVNEDPTKNITTLDYMTAPYVFSMGSESKTEKIISITSAIPQLRMMEWPGENGLMEAKTFQEVAGVGHFGNVPKQLVDLNASIVKADNEQTLDKIFFTFSYSGKPGTKYYVNKIRLNCVLVRVA